MSKFPVKYLKSYNVTAKQLIKLHSICMYLYDEGCRNQTLNVFSVYESRNDVYNT